MNQQEWMSLSFEKQAEFFQLNARDVQEDAKERLYEMFSVVGREHIMEMLNLSKSAYYRLRSGAIRGEGSGFTARQMSALCMRSGFSMTWIITGIGSKYIFEIPQITTTANLSRDADQVLMMTEQILQNIRDIDQATSKMAGIMP
ncbi:MAG: hypothetical protein ACI9GW_002341 [Halieaceae bacterium]|jgi:hypothetical protein